MHHIDLHKKNITSKIRPTLISNPELITWKKKRQSKTTPTLNFFPPRSRSILVPDVSSPLMYKETVIGRFSSVSPCPAPHLSNTITSSSDLTATAHTQDADSVMSLQRRKKLRTFNNQESCQNQNIAPLRRNSWEYSTDFFAEQMCSYDHNMQKVCVAMVI